MKGKNREELNNQKKKHLIVLILFYPRGFYPLLLLINFNNKNDAFLTNNACTGVFILMLNPQDMAQYK